MCLYNGKALSIQALRGQAKMKMATSLVSVAYYFNLTSMLQSARISLQVKVLKHGLQQWSRIWY